MELIKDLDQYKNLLRKYKRELRIGFYNNYLSIDAIKRYIGLSRMYVCEKEKGFIIYIDEDVYFRMIFCMPFDSKIDVEQLSKPILVRNIRKHNDEQEEPLYRCELENSGFQLMGVTLEAIGDAENVFEASSNAERYKRKIINAGYRIEFLGENRIEEIYSLMSETQYLRYYHANYMTEEEKCRMAREGGYLGVINADNELCAATITTINDGKADGMGIVVKPKYKMLGLAIILNHERMRWLCENGIKRMSGWIDRDNEDSLSFHHKLQFEFTGREAEEWLLQ